MSRTHLPHKRPSIHANHNALARRRADFPRDAARSRRAPRRSPSASIRSPRLIAGGYPSLEEARCEHANSVAPILSRRPVIVDRARLSGRYLPHRHDGRLRTGPRVVPVELQWRGGLTPQPPARRWGPPIKSDGGLSSGTIEHHRHSGHRDHHCVPNTDLRVALPTGCLCDSDRDDHLAWSERRALRTGQKVCQRRRALTGAPDDVNHRAKREQHGRPSPAGEAVAILPPIVPALRI